MRFPYSASYEQCFLAYPYATTSKKMRFWYYLQTELEAHIWCVSRSHQYYSHTKYELLTPSRNGRTRISIFLVRETSKFKNSGLVEYTLSLAKISHPWSFADRFHRVGSVNRPRIFCSAKICVCSLTYNSKRMHRGSQS